jgi:hypothetical protein
VIARNGDDRPCRVDVVDLVEEEVSNRGSH